MVLRGKRHKVDRFLLPVAKRLPNIDPNILTGLNLVFALLGGLFIYLGNSSFLLLAFVFIFLNSYLDALDGDVARLHGKATKRGDFLDHVGDRYADIFLLLGITFSVYCSTWIGIFAIIGVLMTSYMGTQAQALGIGRDYGGILGRSERQVILMIAPLMQYLLISIGHTYIWRFTFFEYVMLLFAVAGNFTALHRAAKMWKELR